MSAPALAVAVPRLGILGVGLIGGSIAAAAKARGVAGGVVGFGRSERRLKAAAAAGLLDETRTDAADTADLDLLVVCTPVDRIAADLIRAGSAMPAGSVVTDAGSVKGVICDAVPPRSAGGAAFVGSHPLAGSHRSGWEHAAADLFVGRTAVVCPHPDDAAATERVADFWAALGSGVVRLTPAEHDRRLARTSHAPHALAAVLAAALDGNDAPFAATGLRDCTRVAAGDPDLWASILAANAGHVAEFLGDVGRDLDALRSDLAAGEMARVRDRLAAGAERRRSLYPGD